MTFPSTRSSRRVSMNWKASPVASTLHTMALRPWPLTTITTSQLTVTRLISSRPSMASSSLLSRGMVARCRPLRRAPMFLLSRRPRSVTPAHSSTTRQHLTMPSLSRSRAPMRLRTRVPRPLRVHSPLRVQRLSSRMRLPLRVPSLAQHRFSKAHLLPRQHLRPTLAPRLRSRPHRSIRHLPLSRLSRHSSMCRLQHRPHSLTSSPVHRR